MNASTDTASNNSVLFEIEHVLETRIRPFLLTHAGNLRLLSFENGIVKIRFTGACSGCPSATLTLEALVRDEITKAVPAVKDVIMEQSVSDELYSMAKRLLQHNEVAP